MERFVVIKELMHCYVNSGSATDTAIILEGHLRQFFGRSATTKVSAQVFVEYQAFWMALGVICTEQHRLSLKVRHSNGELSLEDISRQLRLPEYLVDALLSEQYEDEIRDIVS